MWVREARLLQAAWLGTPAGACRLAHALPPNALAQISISLLAYVSGFDAAGRIYMTACVVLTGAALLYLLRARDPDGCTAAAWVCAPLLVGYPFFHGFLNYMAALPVLCFGLGYLLRHPNAPGLRGALLLSGLPLIAFVCHGIALAIWIVFACVTAAVQRSRRLALTAALGLLPSLFLALTYARERIGENASIVWNAGSLFATVSSRLRAPFRFLAVFHGMLPTYGDSWLRNIAPFLSLVNLAFAAAIAWYGIAWAVRARRSPDASSRTLSWIVLTLSTGFVLLPYNFARLLNPAERWVLPIAFAAAAGLAGEAVSSKVATTARLRAIAGTLIAAQAMYVALFGTRAAFAADAVVRAQARDTTVQQAHVVYRQVREPDSRQWPVGVQLLPRHNPLAHLADEEIGLAPVADTGFFRCPVSND